MIQITVPIAFVTNFKEILDSQKENKTVARSKKVVNISEALKFNYLKEEYFASKKESESRLKKAAGR